MQVNAAGRQRLTVSGRNRSLPGGIQFREPPARHVREFVFGDLDWFIPNYRARLTECYLLAQHLQADIYNNNFVLRVSLFGHPSEDILIPRSDGPPARKWYLVVSEKMNSVTVTDAPQSKAQLNQCADVCGEY